MNAAQGKERMEEDQIVLEGENGEKLVFYVLEQTRIAGKSYPPHFRFVFSGLMICLDYNRKPLHLLIQHSFKNA